MRTVTSANRIESRGRRAARGGVALLAGVLLAAALALAAPAPASAAGQAVNGKSILVRFPSQANDGSCVSRNIELGFGTYTWRLGHRFGTLPTQWPIVHTTEILPWDDYVWTDCIVHWGTGYKHSSYLSWDDTYTIAAPEYVFYHAATRGVSTWFGSTLERH